MPSDNPINRRKFIGSAGAVAGLAAIPFIKAHGQSKLGRCGED